MQSVESSRINESCDLAIGERLDVLKDVLCVRWLLTTESTNDDVKARIAKEKQGRGFVRIADIQSRGKGTHGRIWQAPKASLLLTVGVPIDYPIAQAHGLTLAIGVRVVELLRRYNSAVKLKWPNDIWVEDRKVCGISCETSMSADRRLYLVVGIGINIALDEQVQNVAAASGYRPGALFRECPGKESLTKMRLDLAARLIENCREEILSFSPARMEKIRAQWQELDAMAERAVKFTTPDGNVFEGFVQGIDAFGRLRLSCGNRIHTFVDGSLRPLT